MSAARRVEMVAPVRGVLVGPVVVLVGPVVVLVRGVLVGPVVVLVRGVLVGPVVVLVGPVVVLVGPVVVLVGPVVVLVGPVVVLVGPVVARDHPIVAVGVPTPPARPSGEAWPAGVPEGWNGRNLRTVLSGQSAQLSERRDLAAPRWNAAIVYARRRLRRSSEARRPSDRRGPRGPWTVRRFLRHLSACLMPTSSCGGT